MPSETPPSTPPSTPTPTPRPTRVTAALLLALALIACTVTSCTSGAGSSGTAEGGSGVGSQAQAADAQAAGAVAQSGAGGTVAQDASSADLTAQRLVKTATLRLEMADVVAGAAQVTAIAVGAGGSVTHEDLSTDDLTPSSGTSGSATTSGTMTVAVPQARLDATLDQLARLGTVQQRTTSTEDVTKTYVDTASRMATMTASIDRVRALLAKAGAIDQVVALESELSKREADLESLKATLAALDQQTTMSTISLSLTPLPSAATPTRTDETGFLYGLRHGWSAFGSTVSGLATALGALLPFLVTVVVLAGPALLWRRRRKAAASAPRTAPAAPYVAPQAREREAEVASASAAPPVTAPSGYGPDHDDPDPDPTEETSDPARER